ncbi:type II toxin-antitoxin system Phd/YefM family antitoxin [Acetonema longum]|uniref:Antitoxin n=1 Tax=Acetonema longum DSM 6540 TaxID=1009370 RepID=F7NNN6_9FIRM|nr:type II toxin-antitoxin system Phd/YefM family antitoxin [Acetonema longum]EGO62338.1 prevent-host-death family protein [Acetonema longum DSM 6540]
MNQQTPIITNIKPSTAIRHDYNSFSRLCHETQEPVVITKNGEADLVVMSHEAYQKLMARQRLGQMLSEIDRDIAAGVPMRDFEEVFDSLQKRIEHA